MKLGSMIIQITSRFRIRNSRVLVIETETSCEIECDDVQQEVEVRTATSFRKKRRRDAESSAVHDNSRKFSAPLLFVSLRAFHIRLQITKFHFPYMAST